MQTPIKPSQKRQRKPRVLPDVCPACQKATTWELVNKSCETQCRDNTYTVQASMLQCAECGKTRLGEGHTDALIQATQNVHKEFLANEVKVRRAGLGLSQRELACSTDVAISTIKRIELGKIYPKPSNEKSILDTLTELEMIHFTFEQKYSDMESTTTTSWVGTVSPENVS